MTRLITTNVILLISSSVDHYFGDAVAFGVAAAFGDAVAVAVAFGDAAAVAVGEAAAVEAAGLAVAVPAVPGAAGRKPRLLGFFNILSASLFTIFASYIAFSSNAAFKRFCR